MSNFLRASCSGAKNFFPLPNAIFSLGLSAGELAVYAYLMYCEDRKSHQCWPSYKTIGKAVGMSENTVRKYVRELEYKTLILTEPPLLRRVTLGFRTRRKYHYPFCRSSPSMDVRSIV
jgi:hypothetical protein